MSKVSILMNCYNGEKYVRQALDSIYAQTYPNWEIVFIDNCSEDNSAVIAKSYDNRLKYYRTPHNMSLCEARVFAKDFISGDYFCVLDIDDLWMPDKLEKQIKVMGNNPEVGIIYSNSIFFTDDGKENLFHRGPRPSGNIFKQMLECSFMTLETVMVRKSVMDENNLYFSPKYNVNSDTEFFTKICYFTKAHYIHKPLGKHRFGHVSESSRQFGSFPREDELLLEELNEMIPDFHNKYADSIKIAQSRINSVYGLFYWQQRKMKQARKYLLDAAKTNKKYFITYISSFVCQFKAYMVVKNKIMSYLR